MLTASFLYQKSPDKQASSRFVLVNQKPTEFLEGVDLSELSDEQVAEFATQYNTLVARHITALNQLYDEFDLNRQYRRFSPEKVSQLAYEHF